MTQPSIFIDGEYGTTGLGIRQRLEKLPITLQSIPVEQRHDKAARLAMMQAVDLVVLCLPDTASKEAVAMIQALDQQTPKVLDASTAFRVNDQWVYGFPELEVDQAQKIASARYVANPGCYASGAIALLHPLVKSGLIPSNFLLSINAISGYTGGGKQMIAAYEKQEAPAFELYGLTLNHKHLPEITKYSGLSRAPIFVPSVGNFPQGMIVSIPIHLSMLPHSIKASNLLACLMDHYRNSVNVKVVTEEASRLSAEELALTDKMILRIHQNQQEDQVVLTAMLDNLGKGASGAAIQNIRLMLNL